jgi:hypothetical protein
MLGSRMEFEGAKRQNGFHSVLRESGMLPWKVKWKKADDSLVEILCDDQKRAFEIFQEQKAKGFDPWIEDADGRRIDIARPS